MNRSFNLSVVFAATLSSAFATDRVVSPTGTFNTITSAIAASSDGDRILVAPGVYNEFIALHKSVSILSNQEGSRFTLSGGVTLQDFDGKSLTISGARLMGGVRATGTYTLRTEVRITDSFTYSCDLDEPSIRVELMRDSVSGEVKLSSGMIVGCTLLGAPFMGSLVQLRGTTVLPEDVHVVGNSIGSLTSNFQCIEVSSTVPFHIENNFIVDNESGHSAIRILLPSSMVQPASTIVNNSFIKATVAALPAIANVNGYHFNLIVKNNAFFGFTSGMITATPFWLQLIASNNLQGAANAMNGFTGQPMPGSIYIDAGDPDPRYLDLDLTTNDAGCYGGSNSRANFTMGMGSAVVGFMQAPRVVSQGDPVNISATGFDR